MEYQYTLTDITGGILNEAKLHSEIEALGFTGFEGIKREDGTFVVIFNPELSAGDKTTLDTTIANHDGVALPITARVCENCANFQAINTK